MTHTRIKTSSAARAPTLITKSCTVRRGALKVSRPDSATASSDVDDDTQAAQALKEGRTSVPDDCTIKAPLEYSMLRVTFAGERNLKWQVTTRRSPVKGGRAKKTDSEVSLRLVDSVTGRTFKMQ